MHTQSKLTHNQSIFINKRNVHSLKDLCYSTIPILTKIWQHNGTKIKNAKNPKSPNQSQMCIQEPDSWSASFNVTLHTCVCGWVKVCVCVCACECVNAISVCVCVCVWLCKYAMCVCVCLISVCVHLISVCVRMMCMQLSVCVMKLIY